MSRAIRSQLPAGLDLTAYRLVQEGLTNAVKHARATHAEVLVRYDDGHVELTVTDDGTGDGGGESGGHGLVGMRERVSVYGGELEAGPLPAAATGCMPRSPSASSATAPRHGTLPADVMEATERNLHLPPERHRGLDGACAPSR